MTTMDDDTLRAMLEGLRCGSVHITANRCTGDIRAVEAFCDLVRVAPALAAEVLRLRETNRAVGASLADTRADFHAMEAAFYEMRERAEKAEAERDALRAAVREWFDAETAAVEAARVAEHAWGREVKAACDALERANARCMAATARLHAIAGGGR